MNKSFNQVGRLAAVSLSVLLSTVSPRTEAVINGVTGTTFDFVACQFSIPTPDGGNVPMWGYGMGTSAADCANAQYPGPTLILNQGDQVTINLSNVTLPVATSIVFPGQQQQTAAGGVKGLFTQEASPAGAPVTYTFVAGNPGTYMYESATNPALQTEMGLMGAIVVRPTGFNNSPITVNGVEKANPLSTAYGTTDSYFDYEYLFFLSEIDPDIHSQYAQGHVQHVDNTKYKSVLWFINGRNFPDTLGGDNHPAYPHQPYGIVPQTRPGEKLLMRMVGGSRHAHPFHTHGSNFQVIAQDGRLLSSDGVASDLGRSDYTLVTYPGQTYDALFLWTGKQMGWDLYGDPAGNISAGILPHDCIDTVDNKTGAASVSGPFIPGDGFDDVTFEWCLDHGKPLKDKVTLPSTQDMTFGGFYSGSAFLGEIGSLPPGEGGLNPTAAYLYAWHSHSEKELINNDIFPGGMFTALLIHPYAVTIPRQ